MKLLLIDGHYYVYRSFFASQWMNTALDPLGAAFDFSQYFFWFYVGANALFTPMVMAMDRLPLVLMQWGVFALSLVEGLRMSFHTV